MTFGILHLRVLQMPLLLFFLVINKEVTDAHGFFNFSSLVKFNLFFIKKCVAYLEEIKTYFWCLL